jgi:acetyl-CoA carboxylase biotin carboxyl carrier protein
VDLSKIKDLKDLKELLDLKGRYDLAEVELEADGQRIRLRKTESPPAQILGYPAVAPLQAAGSAPASPAGQPPAAAPAAALPANIREVASPMVGTFYRSSSPEADPFVKEGDVVEPDTILCIVEAMKVMNEIPAGIAGIVREILVKNGESVEYGRPLFRIEVE